MAQSGFTPISLYYSATAAAVPTAGNLVAGELALNTNDGKLYFKNSSNVVTLLAQSSASSPVTSISFGSTGLTPSTATTGAVTVAGTLVVGNGGTGLTSLTTGRIPYGANTAAFGNSANLFFDSANTRLGVGTASPAVTASLVGIDAMLVPKGATGDRPTGVAGYFRFNTTSNEFEGYNGTAWSSVGGAALSNDTTTSTNIYPLSAAATSGSASTLYTSNAKFLYKPSTGELQASELVASNGIVVNSQTISTSYTIAAGNNAMSSGPVTVASGQTVTVSSGSRWVVL